MDLFLQGKNIKKIFDFRGRILYHILTWTFSPGLTVMVMSETPTKYTLLHSLYWSLLLGTLCPHSVPSDQTHLLEFHVTLASPFSAALFLYLHWIIPLVYQCDLIGLTGSPPTDPHSLQLTLTVSSVFHSKVPLKSWLDSLSSLPHFSSSPQPTAQ